MRNPLSVYKAIMEDMASFRLSLSIVILLCSLDLLIGQTNLDFYSIVVQLKNLKLG